MGDQCGWAYFGDSKADYRGNPSLPNTPHGLVQCQTSNSIGASIPSNANECSPNYLPLTDSARGLMEEPWWKFHSDALELEEMSNLVWNSIPQISTTLILCEIIPKESLSARRMLEN